MSTADYVAKYPRRVALREKMEQYWLEEAKSTSFLLVCVDEFG